MRSVSVALAALCAGLTSCGGGGHAPTQVIVRVDGDTVVRGLARQVRVEVRGRGATAGSLEVPVLEMTYGIGDGEGAELPFVIPLVPERDDATRRFMVRATATDATGALVAARLVRSTYVRDRRTEIRVVLRACHTLSPCDLGHTCIDDACAPACVTPTPEGVLGDDAESAPVECTDVPDAGPPDAGPPDAGPPDSGPPDAGPPDAGPPDAGPPCPLGCFDGTDCQPGTDVRACGVPASSCVDCGSCPTATCSAGACGSSRRVTTVTTGAVATCVLYGDGTRACAGSNSQGALGIGTTAGTVDALRVPPAEMTWSRLASGGRFACGIRMDRQVSCYGEDNFGGLGRGTTDVDSGNPAPIMAAVPTGGWREVYVGFYHACALDRDGAAWCWGRNVDGQLGVGDTADHNVPVALPGHHWVDLALGVAHSCGIETDGTLWCWGSDGSGRLGDGPTDGSTSRPVSIGADHWEDVSAGAAHTCGVRTDGTLWCWGAGRYGRLGTGDELNVTAPVQIGTETDWSAVSAGNEHTCGLRGGTVYCWGQNASCQLGLLGSLHEYTPHAIGLSGPGASFTSLATSWNHACAVRTDGALVCWGYNHEGEIGLPLGDSIICDPRLVCLNTP